MTEAVQRHWQQVLCVSHRTEHLGGPSLQPRASSLSCGRLPCLQWVHLHWVATGKISATSSVNELQGAGWAYPGCAVSVDGVRLCARGVHLGLCEGLQSSKHIRLYRADS
eukprot:3586411-Amphidinium_carterae.1